MEFELFFDTNLSYNNFVELVIIAFSKAVKKTNIKKDEDGYYLCSEYFTVTLFDDSFGYDMIEEDYNVRATLSICIQLFTKVAEKGMSILLNNIGVLLKKIDGDAIFLGDSTTLILKRLNNKIFVYDNPDDYFFRISFDDLGEGHDIIKE